MSEERKSKFLDLKANARALVGGVVLVVVLWAGYSFWVLQHPEVAAAGGRPATMFEAARQPKVVWDEDVAVPAREMKGKSWTFPAPQAVRVRIDGKAETAKGFSVYFMPTAEEDKVLVGGFTNLPTLSGKAVQQVDGAGNVPAGEWTLAIVNSENLVDEMTVHVTVTFDP